MLSYNAEQAYRIMKNDPQVIVLDVRDEFEWKNEHIPGSRCIPYLELEEKALKELPDHDKLLLVYCQTGYRALIAVQILQRLGYEKAVSFGGIEAWPFETESSY